MNALRRAFARDRAVRAVAAAAPRGTLEEVVAHTRRTRGRPVLLFPVRLTNQSMSGVWLQTPECDFIAYPDDATEIRKSAVVCHEVAHMLLGHAPTMNPQLPEVLRGLAPTVDSDIAARFLKDPTVLGALMRSHAYRTPYERDAEVVGTRIVAHLRRASAIGGDAASQALR